MKLRRNFYRSLRRPLQSLCFPVMLMCCSPLRADLSLAPVTDLWLDLCYGPHTPAVMDRKMEVFEALGFDRMYFVTVAPGVPAFAMRFLDPPADPERYGHYGLASYRALNGNPNREAIRAAQAKGMKAFAIFKPYESGTGRTLPLGTAHPTRDQGLPDVGGIAYGFCAFTLKNPQMRLQRRPDPTYTQRIRQPITSIDLLFCRDRELLEEQGEAVPEETPLVPENLEQTVRVFASTDNGTYERLDPGSYQVTLHEESMVLTDAEGVPLREDGQPSPVTRIHVSGLSMAPTLRFLAVQWGEAGETAWLIPPSMVRTNGPSGTVPTSITTQVRQNLIPLGGERTWGDFRKNGFEFHEYGWGRRHPGWDKTQQIGIARGWNTHLKGILCEAYPEVRAYWLARIQALLEVGADGIDIRLVGHSAMDTDYASYGYNPPVVEAFRKEYGRAPDGGIEDFKKLMRIRGRIFESFLREARDLVHAHDATFKLHLHASYLWPDTDGAFRGMVQWGMPKLFLDWEVLVDLADEITLKDHFHGRYNPRKALPLKQRAKELGKPLWIHCYLTQGNDFQPSFFEAVREDPLVSGVLLYETVKRNNPNHGGPARPGIVGAAPDGGLLLDGTSIRLIQQLQGERADGQTLDRLLQQHQDLRPEVLP